MSSAMMTEWVREREVLSLAVDAAQAFASALALIAQLILALLRPAIRVLTPAVAVAARFSWAKFSSQPPRTIALQLAFLLICIALALLEHRFRFLRRTLGFLRSVKAATRSRYRAFLNALARHSRVAAAAAPHFLFITIVYVCETIIAPWILQPLRTLSLLLASCVVPTIRTIRLLYSVDFALEGDTPIPSERQSSSSPTNVNPTARPPTQPKKNGKSRRLSSLRRRATAVAEQIECDGEVSDHTTNNGSSAPSPDTPLAFSRTVSAPAFPAAQKTLPATGLARARRPRTAFTDEDERAARRKSETELLKFWICAAVAVAVRSVARYLFPIMLVGVLDRADSVMFYYFVWLQAGFTKGFRVVYPALATVAGKSGAREMDGKAAQLAQQQRGQRVNFALRIAVALNVLSSERADDLGSTIAESGVALAGVAFFFTPGFLTFLGTVLIGLLAPAYLSAGVLQIVSGAATTRRNWLTYWAVYAVVQVIWDMVGVYLDWLPLWYHVKMAVVLWLQLPYYRGAAIVLHQGVMGVSFVATKVTRTSFTPRKIKLQ